MTGSRLMAAFSGTELPMAVAAAIGRGSYAGVSLFRGLFSSGPQLAGGARG